MLIGRKRVTGLAAPELGKVEKLVELINSTVQPNQPLSDKDVFIRSMHLTSDRINTFGGRFDIAELQKMKELAADCPVLVGHNHQLLPIGRNYKADLIRKEEATWLITHFYWLAESAGAADLAKNIDGGIYKEVSAAFLFEYPECSVCEKDIRTCEHIPFRRYFNRRREAGPAFFWYKNVTKMLETSLVYRGAVPETKIGHPLQAEDDPFGFAQGNEPTPKGVGSLPNSDVFITKNEQGIVPFHRKKRFQSIYR